MKIISGGQTGVDRGALDAALAAGVDSGGWCPAGRLAEDGRIPDRYPLVELDGGYAERTTRNVADSDATLIVAFGPVQGGTRTTIDCCIEQQKPHEVIDASRIPADEAASIAQAFIAANATRVLNVAGPRASEVPAAYDYAFAFICRLLAADQQ